MLTLMYNMIIMSHHTICFIVIYMVKIFLLFPVNVLIITRNKTHELVAFRRSGKLELFVDGLRAAWMCLHIFVAVVVRIILLFENTSAKGSGE